MKQRTNHKKPILSIIAMLLVVTVLATFSLGVSAMEPAEGKIYEGIDVSAWQGDTDFAAVKAAGKEVVYIRASVGSNYIDPYFERNYNGAVANGLSVGFYHYMTATSISEAQEEARFFASVISGKAANCRPAMDYESFDGLSSGAVTSISLAFLETLEDATGQEVCLYSDAYNASRVFGPALAKYPLWIAEYGVGSPSNNGKWERWSGFQYSDTGRVNGIQGNVDLDYFTEALFLDDTTPPPAQETYINYTVKRGDTLWALANRYNTTVNAIVERNNIANPDLIYVGEQLKIPTAGYTTQTYVVQRGDTLWGIAQRFHTTVGHLVALNHIQNPDLIYPGETIEY